MCMLTISCDGNAHVPPIVKAPLHLSGSIPSHYERPLGPIYASCHSMDSHTNQNLQQLNHLAQQSVSDQSSSAYIMIHRAVSWQQQRSSMFNCAVLSAASLPNVTAAAATRSCKVHKTLMRSSNWYAGGSLRHSICGQVMVQGWGSGCGWHRCGLAHRLAMGRPPPPPQAPAAATRSWRPRPRRPPAGATARTWLGSRVQQLLYKPAFNRLTFDSSIQPTGLDLCQHLLLCAHPPLHKIYQSMT